MFLSRDRKYRFKNKFIPKQEGITEGRQRIFLWFHSIADFELANDAQKIGKNYE